MTSEEFAMSQGIYQNRMQTLADLGIPVNASEKHTMVVIEVPSELDIDVGKIEIDKIKDKAVEHFTAIMQILLAPGTKEGLIQFGAELWGLAGLAEKRAFWKQMFKGGKYVISYEKGIRFIQFYPTTHFTAMMKSQPNKKTAKKIKKGLVKYNKRYKFPTMTFYEQFKRLVPWLQKSKMGFLEKYIAGASKGGVMLQIIFIGTIETGQWAMDEKSQAVDLWGIWGIAIGQGLIAGVGYSVGAMTGTVLASAVGVGVSATLVVTVGVGILVAVVVSYGVAYLLDKYKVKENLKELLRSLESPKRDDSTSLALQSLYMGVT